MSKENENKSLIDKIKGIDNAGIMAIMLVFIIVVVFLAGPSKFFNVTNITSLIRSEAVVGIIAVAVTFVMITANIDLSVGWMVGLCACVCGANSDNAAVAILLPIIVGGLCGALNGLLVGGLKLNAFITTLGTMYVFEGIAYLYAKGKSLSGGSGGSAFLKGIGQGSFIGIPMPIWILAVLAVIFWFVLRKTTFGARVYTVGANPIAARFSGISPGKIVFMTYTLTGLATGLAGVVLFSKVMSTQVYSGAGLEFDVLTGVVLGGTSVTGGKGNIPGTILGVIFVGILANGFTLLGLSSNVQYVAQGIILLIAVGTDVIKERGR
jgi:ribose transport system permease protein